MRAFRRSRPQCINPRFQCQLGHVTRGHAFLLAVCIIMLPMLVVTAEHAHLATTDHMNPMDQWCIHPCHTTFKRTPLILPSLNNILPAMALQNEIVKSNIWCLSRSSSHASVRHVSSSQGFSVSSGLVRMVVGAVVVLWQTCLRKKEAHREGVKHKRSIWMEDEEIIGPHTQEKWGLYLQYMISYKYFLEHTIVCPPPPIPPFLLS